MAASNITVELETAYPMWVARQLLEIVQAHAAEAGYEVSDNFVSTFTIELVALPDGGEPEKLRAALKELGALPSVSFREHVE